MMRSMAVFSLMIVRSTDEDCAQLAWKCGKWDESSLQRGLLGWQDMQPAAAQSWSFGHVRVPPTRKHMRRTWRLLPDAAECVWWLICWLICWQALSVQQLLAPFFLCLPCMGPFDERHLLTTHLSNGSPAPSNASSTTYNPHCTGQGPGSPPVQRGVVVFSWQMSRAL